MTTPLTTSTTDSPYTPSTIIIPAIPAIDDSPEVPERTTIKTLLNISPENKDHYQSEKEAIHLLLTGIGDEIYSTVDACKIAHDIFYKMMNKMVRNNLTVATMQVYVQFLQRLQPELSRFVTNVKQNHDLDTVSYHKLFDVLKQYQKEVNEIHAERIAKNANPLALIAKPTTPSFESASEEDNDPEQAQRDKDMQKNLALIAKLGSLGQRTVTVVGDRETVGSQETKKSKRLHYHKEKMLLCKQAEKGVPLKSERADWIEDTDEEIDEQELEAHYSYMAKIQEVPTADSGTNTEPLKKVHYNVEYNVFANARQHSEQPEAINNTCVVEKVDKCDDERAALSNLIENMTVDSEENKNILKQLKKANASLTQELKECKSNIEESNTTRDSCLIALQSKQTELETYKTSNDHTVNYDKLEQKLNETLGLLAQKEIDIKEGLKFKAYDISVVKEKHNELVKHIFLTKSHYEGLVKEKTKEILYDTSDLANRFVPDREETLTLEKESRSKLNKDLMKPYDYTKQNSLYENFKPASQEYHDQLAHVNEYVESLKKEINKLESDKADFSNMYDLLLQELKECECLAEKLSKQTKTISKDVYTELLRSFAKLEKNSISIELALQQCQEQMKNDTVCKEKASNVFLKEREQYFKIQDLKAQLQDKNIAISVLKKLIEKCKGKYVETKFDKPSVVRQPNAQRILKHQF
ncbi:hypothetical protein Tco_0644723 [Tanacetum coccineum]